MKPSVHSARARLAGRCRMVLGHEEGERGAIVIVAALVLTIVVFAGALSLDIAGRVSEVRRDQATADLAALDAARDPTHAQTLAAASALRNGVATDVTATVGSVSVVNGVNTFTAGAGSAVQVVVSTPYNDFLGGINSHMAATAVAQNSGRAGFSIGSTLVDVTTGIGKAGGGSFGLVGYKGLASGNVTLGALATQLGFGALTADNVLNSQVSVAQLVNASAALIGSSDPAYAALTTLGESFGVNTAGTNANLMLKDILGLQTGAGVGLGASVNLLHAVSGALQLANGKAAIGANVGLSVLGVAGASFSLSAIVPSTVAFGPVGTTATNTQVTVTLNVDLNIGLATVHLPLTMSLGGAIGTLKAIDCTGTSPSDIKMGTTFQSVTAATSSGSVSIYLVGNVGTVSGTVTSAANPVADATLNETTNFTPNAAGTTPNDNPVTVSSNLAGASANFTGSGLTGGLTAAALNLAVQNALPGLITAVTSSLAGTIGVNVGNADYLGIQPPPPLCIRPALVH